MEIMIFQDLEAGYLGTMHDAQVLQNNNIFTRAENCEIPTGPPISVGGNDILPYLVGDSGYPLSNWLMKPFPREPMIPKREFNKELSSAIIKVSGVHFQSNQNLLENIAQASE